MAIIWERGSSDPHSGPRVCSVFSPRLGGSEDPRSKRVGALLALVIALFAATPAIAADDLGAIVRGGRLYDNWYKELDEKPPGERHKAYPGGGVVAAEPAKTWRCVECHGWDYRGKEGAYGWGEHYTGIKGIDGWSGGDAQKVVAILVDPAHGYGDLLDRADLADLATFVVKGQSPLMGRIDGATAEVAADASQAQALYQTICATCHGADGQQMAGVPTLGDLARSDPWQALHNVLNGHAGGAMPALRALDESLVLATLAYLQALPGRAPVAAITRGGRLYDNWARETGRQPPNGAHPAYPRPVDGAAAARGTWNCRECHGWDYAGRDGAFASGRHATGIKGIRAMAGAEPAKIVAVLTNETHRYQGLLPSSDLSDLASFVAKGQTDMARFVDVKTGRIKGQAKIFEPHFQTMCATCHGLDGRKVRTMAPLGRVVQEEPWRALHSVLNGHPGESMPPLRAFPEEMVAGLLAYAQGLPERK